jgi:hypothetical protein
MPNWCSNTLHLEHSDPAMIDRAEQAFNAGKFLNEFIPVPQSLHEAVAGSFSDQEQQAANQALQASNLEKYGYATWYDFCVNEWGTKWEVSGESERLDPNTLSLRFDSAWSPPCTAYEALTALGFAVDAMYYEPGMGFCGRWTDGEDRYVEFSGLSSLEAVDVIDSDVDEAFGITESMAEWEAEQEDEDSEDDESDEDCTVIMGVNLDEDSQDDPDDEQLDKLPPRTD